MAASVETKLLGEVDVYKTDLINICQEMADINIKKIKESYDELYNRIESAVKNNIAKSIGTKDLYNYDEIPKINRHMLHELSKIFAKQFVCIEDLFAFFRKINASVACHCNTCGKCNKCGFLEDIDNFMKMIDNEKVVCVTYHKYIIGTQEHSKHIFITNYGKYLETHIHDSYKIISNNYAKGKHNKEYKFWIPTDYIKLINLLKPTDIDSSVFDFIKNHMYDRKILPLYAIDAMKENKELKDKYETFEKDKIKKDFYTTYNEHMNIANEKALIQQDKEKLRLISAKLKMEQHQLDKEKEILHSIDAHKLLDDA